MSKSLLDYTNPEFQLRYIARDEDGSLWAYDVKPVKGQHTWGSDILHPPESLYLFEHHFPYIKWEDREPYKVERSNRD